MFLSVLIRVGRGLLHFLWADDLFRLAQLSRGVNMRQHPEAERQYARDAKALEPVAFRRLSPRSHRLLEQAEFQARARDDNHVGTTPTLRSTAAVPTVAELGCSAKEIT